MIKANNKDALGAFFQTKSIIAAYFRGSKIWEHSHAWNQNGMCTTCGRYCSHSWNNTTSGGTCSICGLTHTHSWNPNGYCSTCGYDGAAKIYFQNTSSFNLTASENSIRYDNMNKTVNSIGPYRIPPGRRAVTIKMYCSPPSNAIGALYLSNEDPPDIITGSGTAWGVAGYLTCTPQNGEDGKYTYAVCGTYTINVNFYYKS